MFIDLDHFKNINDTLGHTAGDELLLEMSQRLRRCVREDDTVARLGGDEFTIILADLRQPEDAAHVAQKVIEAVQKPLKLGAVPVEVSVFVGVGVFVGAGVLVTMAVAVLVDVATIGVLVGVDVAVPVGVGDPPLAASRSRARFQASGEPQPVMASHPLVQLYAPLVPLVMSWYSEYCGVPFASE